MPAAPSKPRLLFVVTEDWFFVSHFLPMARAALAGGFDVAVACRVRSHRAVLEGEGLRVIEVEAERRSLNPLKVIGAILKLRTVMRPEKPDIVHLIALKAILTGGIAAKLAGVSRRVVALTGLGFFGAGRGLVAASARLGLRAAIRLLIDGRGTRFLFENRSDPVTLGLDPDNRAKVTIVGGAGVDPAALSPRALPPQPPLKLALVSRMLWSKGVDIAVEAVRAARKDGADVTLSLYGAPDPSNPRAIPEATLKEWSREPGISWLGPTSDVGAVWGAHHLCVLPSRGGEGLPRAILEAAACGRAILTTDVPGCRDFVRDGVEGMVAPSEDSNALARAIVALAGSADTVAAMGMMARARLLDGHTEEAVGEAVVALYRDMLA
jgi:glycosyltransferase involved in cell wall biosynthesis